MPTFETIKDSWENKVTGLGTSIDKQVYHSMYPDTWLTEQQLENLYYADPYAKRFVTEVVKASLRPGWILTIPDATEEESRAIHKYLNTLGLRMAYREARYWGRLYGRGALLLGAEDGREPNQPLDIANVKELRFLEPLTSTEFSPTGKYIEDPKDPKYGEPEIWNINRTGGVNQQIQVHHTRLIICGGETTSRQKRMENEWRDASILQSIYPALRTYNAAIASMGHMLADSSQAVLKIQDFSEMLASDDLTSFTNRMRILEYGRSMHIMPIDAATESFEYVERTFAGVADVIDRLTKNLAGAGGMPITLLTGQSPAGLSATGESDLTLWDMQVSAEQEQIDDPNLTLIYSIAASAAGLNSNVSIEMLPPRPTTREEDLDLSKTEAEIRLINTQAVEAGATVIEEDDNE